MVESWYDNGVVSMPDALKIFNIRLPLEMHADLNTMATEQKRSLHNMIVVILQAAIDQWKKERRSFEPS